MNFLRAIGRLVLAAPFIVFCNITLAQQAYPVKPIRFILPNAPGGSNSVVARVFADKLVASWGQPVVVDNRPGGNNVIANEALLRSVPDGHTIALISASHAINPFIFKQPYDPIRDFAAVATLVRTEYILVIHPSVAANNLKEFIALAKANPDKFNVASSGSGGVQHLAMEMFNVLAGVKLHHVPYKGGGPGMSDLVGGHVQAAFNNFVSVGPHVNAGRLRPLAIGGETRLPQLPNVPTFTEAGVPGFTVSNWFGVTVPARTPKPVIAKLADEIARIQAMPDVKDKLSAHGAELYVMGPEKFDALIKVEMARYSKLIKGANIRVE
jgi:tripartite-type tricarboxylate transporter receptor subunit TctC